MYINNYRNHTVALECGSIGTVSRSSIHYEDIYSFVGDQLTISSHDEYGIPIKIYGTVTEILQVAYLDQV